MASPALEWIWRLLRDVSRPGVLDCGTLTASTFDIYLRRCGKLYIGDLTGTVLREAGRFWQRQGKVLTFLTDRLLAELPRIPENSLSAAFCWHLLDLVPPDAVAPIVERLYGCLQPGGTLFCLLRQSYLPNGADAVCGLVTLTSYAATGGTQKPFAYPIVQNREIEKLLPPGSVKIFLTRSGRREVVALK